MLPAFLSAVLILSTGYCVEEAEFMIGRQVSDSVVRIPDHVKTSVQPPPLCSTNASHGDHRESERKCSIIHPIEYQHIPESIEIENIPIETAKNDNDIKVPKDKASKEVVHKQQENDLCVKESTEKWDMKSKEKDSDNSNPEDMDIKGSMPSPSDVANDLPNCTGVQGPICDVTLVTALMDLDRSKWSHFRRKFTDYLHYAIPVLNLHVPMVIYVEPQTRAFVEKHRKGKEHITKIILTEVEDLEYYKNYTRIKDIMQSENFTKGNPLLTHPEGFSPEYNILMNSKLSLLRHATRRNHFRNEYFFWMDMGYGHGNDIFPRGCYWAPRNLMTGRDAITYIMLNKLSWLDTAHDLYKTKLPPFVNGGFFGGSRVAVDRYYFLHRQVFKEWLDDNMVDDDQTLAVACYFRNKHLFNMVEGWWYDVFTLFN